MVGDEQMDFIKIMAEKGFIMYNNPFKTLNEYIKLWNGYVM